jgi:hypothetical protein
MNSSAPQLNLIVAWLGILLGFASGMGLGLCFHREDWLGGYASFRRRLYRLAHISFFGLGATNLLFWLTVKNLSVSGAMLDWASILFALGAATMPVCCLLMAHFPKARLLFSIPVVSLLIAGALTLAAVIPAAGGSHALRITHPEPRITQHSP